MKCVVTTSLLVSTGIVSNAAMLPCIDDEVYLVHRWKTTRKPS